MVENRHAGQALLFFSSLPDLKKLCVVTLTVKKVAKPGHPTSNTPATGKFQLQITKCRELIFTEPGILASPSVDDYDTINIIVQTHVYESGRLKPRFEKMNLCLLEVSDVTLSLLQCCLMYTMVAKLAPNWNKVGDILVQGRDFLTCKGPMNAVKVQMTACAEELCMAVEAKTVKLPQTTIEDFAVDPQAAWIFYSNPYAVVSEHFIEDRWCYVLPSNKKGQVISITRQLPENCPFQSYSDLRRHWKNTYGYRLPESEDGLFYYNIYFRPIGENIFTYPCWCVRKCDVVQLMRTDCAAVSAAFLADLHARLPAVCGHVLRFTRKPLYATTKLKEASAQVFFPTYSLGPNSQPLCIMPSSQSYNGSSLFRGSLTAAAPPSSGSYRPVAKPSSCTLTQPVRLASSEERTAFPATQPISSNISHATGMSSSQQSVRHKEYNRSCQAITGISSTMSMSLSSEASSTKSQQQHRNGASREDSSPQGLSQQVIPPSQSTPARAPGSALNGALDRSIVSAAARIYGQAALNQKSSSGASVIGRWAAGLATSDHGQSSTSVNGRPIPAGARIVPIFTPKKLEKQEKRGRESNTGKTVPTFRPVGARSVPVFKRKGQATQKQEQPSAAKPNDSIQKSQGNIPRGNVPDVSLLSRSQDNSSVSQSFNNPNNLQRTPQVGPMAMKPKQLNFGKSPLQPQCQKMSSGSKRKVEETGLLTPKKPRPKPKVQENVDILALAHANQLEKVNTATLIAWLRERGVMCKARDKKGDLVHRVMAVTQLRQSEP